jgi:hypothetical protein
VRVSQHLLAPQVAELKDEISLSFQILGTLGMLGTRFTVSARVCSKKIGNFSGGFDG